MYAFPNSRAAFSIMKKGCAMHSLNDFTFELHILLCQSPWYCHISIEVQKNFYSEYELKSRKKRSQKWHQTSKREPQEEPKSWCRSMSSTCRIPSGHEKDVLQGFRRFQVHSRAEKMGLGMSLCFYFHVWIRVFPPFFYCCFCGVF